MKVSIIGSDSFLAKFIVNNNDDIDWNLYGRNAYYFPGNSISQIANQDLVDSDIILFTAGAGIQPGHTHSDALIFELNCFEIIRLINFLNAKKFSGRLITFGSYFELGIYNKINKASENELIGHANKYPNSYCESKNLLSRYISQRINSVNTFVHQHFILTNIFGFGENEDRLIPYILRKTVDSEPIRFTSGSQVRQYTDVSDIAKFLISKVFNISIEGIYNFSSSKLVSVKDIINSTFEAMSAKGYQIPTSSFGVENKRDSTIDFLALDTTLVHETFGDYSFKPLSESMNFYAEQFLNDI